MIATMPDLTQQLPSSLRANARWMPLGQTRTPALVVHPQWETSERAPVMLWMHGRTATKELDPGRYLRWMRAGIGACAVDLPGHGERFDARSQEPDQTLDLILEMVDEIDGIVEHLAQLGSFDMNRIGIGGMSAGGMATFVRLRAPHDFRCACGEATTGSWQPQCEREMFRHRDPDEVERRNPLHNLANWREIPLQAIHSRLDEWVCFDGQVEFLDALRKQYTNQDNIEFVIYDDTGAPFEHAGFGKHAADAKNRQRDFLVKHLLA